MGGMGETVWIALDYHDIRHRIQGSSTNQLKEEPEPTNKINSVTTDKNYQDRSTKYQ